MQVRRAAMVLTGVLVVAAAVLLYETRGLIFYFDEWSFLLGRRGNDAATFLEPHNEHPSIVAVLAWKALWTTFGADGYLPYRLAIVAVHVLCCVLLWLVARRRLGPWLALIPATLVAFLGPAFEDLLWPFQISFLAPVACWLGIVLALEHRRDLVAAVLLTIALFSAGTGVPVAVGTAVVVLLGPDVRRRVVRVLLVPCALYGLWVLTYGVRGTFRLSHVLETPRVVFDSAAACLAALTGIPWQWGRLLALVFFALVVWRLVRRDAPLAALATMLAFWAAQGLLRGGLHGAPASHYLYPGAVFIVVVLIELVPRPLPSLPRGVPVVVVALVAVIVVSNVHALHQGGRGFRATSEILAAELGAMELTRPMNDFEPDPGLVPQITAGPYLAMVRDLGSIADPPARIASRTEPARQAADVTLLRAARVSGLPAAGEDCTRAADEQDVPSAGIVVRAGGAPVTVALRRFGRGYARPGHPPARVTFADVPDTEHLAFPDPVEFRIPAGAAVRLAPPGAGWHAAVAGQFAVCAR